MLDGLLLRQKGRRFDLNAKNALGCVGIKVSQGPAAVGADVWEEAEHAGADILKDIVADDHQWWYLLLFRLRARAEPVNVQEDLVRALSKDGRNHKVATIEERNTGSNQFPTQIGCAIKVSQQIKWVLPIGLCGSLIPCLQDERLSFSYKLTAGRPTCHFSR